MIEAFLEGEEASFFALCDGTHAIPFGTAQDHKRVFDGDEGPNTGGMGAYSPAAVLTPELQARVMREIIEPTLAGMRARGTPYTGILYAGLMLTKDGPQLIEYNARLGDPETQVLLPRLKSDLVTALLAACDGVLDSISLQWSDARRSPSSWRRRAIPARSRRDRRSRTSTGPKQSTDVIVFHAGTKQDGDRILANGGRVLNVTALGRTISEAQGESLRGRRCDRLAGGLLPPATSAGAPWSASGPETPYVRRVMTLRKLHYFPLYSLFPNPRISLPLQGR